jgi:hypothetical protein
MTKKKIPPLSHNAYVDEILFNTKIVLLHPKEE